MKTYFYLQLKRIFRIFPYVLLVAVLLFGSQMALFGGILKLSSSSADQKLFQIAIVGDTEHSFLQFGLSALESFDSSRFAIKIIEMDEEDAKEAIETGDISAYVVIPKGFIKNAIHGDVGTLKYVTTPGSIGLVSIFKDEITKVVSDVVVNSQKGVYGLADAMDANGQEQFSNEKLNDLSIEYVDFILSRSHLYKMEILGIADHLPLPLYFFCGITILFLLLIGLPCAPLFIKKDLSLNRVLASKGISSWKQILCEYFSYFASLAVILLFIFSVIAIIASNIRAISELNLFDFSTMPMLALKILPMLAMIAAFSFFMYEVSSDLVSGILLQFFISLSLAYVSGCLYPIFAFPETIQKLSALLPTGIARTYLANCMIGNNLFSVLIGTLLYLVLFIGLAIFVRTRKILKAKG